MKENILIVEDEFIVATDLRFKLIKAGYTVCGIAATVDEAKELIEEKKPTWVLLDIFLQDESYGTDLGAFLTERNIGFIYVSANTNQSVLEKAKATQPYGFLVKPFRMRDLLIMLDIASKKHQNNIQLNVQRELVWRQQLKNISESPIAVDAKLLRIPGAFQSFIPFDYMKIELLNKKDSGITQFSFIRVGFDEYQILKNTELQLAMGLSANDIAKFRPTVPAHIHDGILNRMDYKKSLLNDLWEKQLSNFYSLQSKLIKNFWVGTPDRISLSFYSRNEVAYSDDQLLLLRKTDKEIIELLAQLKGPGTHVAGRVSTKLSEKRVETEIIENKKFDGILGKSPSLLHVLDRINMVATSATSVLITGESGTGKERIAKCIHNLSPRNSKPLVIVNCAALPYELIESELFGHEKGSFTGAIDKRIGKFEAADGGTIFLDEIGELPIEAQVKLLRVTQEMEFERVGSSKTTKVNVRIIAATNKNLEREVSQGRFRLDLYYRLNVFPIELPPLRERQEDINLLAQSFITRYAEKTGKSVKGMSAEVLKSLYLYSWPGNIRELEHVIERAVLTTQGEIINEMKLTSNILHVQNRISDTKQKTFEENEADHIINILRSCQGKVGGPGGAAEILGLPVSTLHSKIKKLGIKKEFESGAY